MRQIKLHKQAAKFIAGLPQKHQRQIACMLLTLQENAQPQDAKKLHGYNFYRVDSGEYRAIYNWDEVVVSIYIIGKRNDSDVYRKLQRGLK